VRNPNPRSAQRFGIEVVPQHLALCDNLGAAMNIVLGRPPLKWGIGGFGIVDRKRAETIARDGLREVGATVADVSSPIRRMSGGQRQAIAIARALLRGGKMIIFDEPTAALGVRQRQTTLNLIRQLADRGLATLMISHNIDDVFAIADRVIAFRQGRVVLNSTVEATSRDAVHLAMEGLSDG
jgi:ABC-type sugar transport system ATPase subunit